MKILLFTLISLKLTFTSFSVYSMENTFDKTISSTTEDLPTDFSQEKIYQISQLDVIPNWESHDVNLVIKDQKGQAYEIENLSWENLSEMELNIGDQFLLSGTQLIDFGHYGTVFHSLYFIKSEFIYKGKTTDQPNLSFEDAEGWHVTVFNLKDEGEYLSFQSDAYTWWLLEKDSFDWVENGQRFCIASDTEQFMRTYVGASSYDFYFENNKTETLGKIIGRSQSRWEPAVEDEDRVFTVGGSVAFYPKTVDSGSSVIHEKTDELIWYGYQNQYSWGTRRGERIFVLNLVDGSWGEGWYILGLRAYSLDSGKIYRQFPPELLERTATGNEIQYKIW